MMLRLKLVKGIELVVEEDNDEPNNESSLLHGKQVLKTVVSPWFGSNHIVCADFTSLLLERRKSSTGPASVSSALSRPQQVFSQKLSSLMWS
jgi:hypothetical protein